jgi:hypothetical protein
LEGSVCSLIEILFLHLLGGTEKYRESPRSGSR